MTSGKVVDLKGCVADDCGASDSDVGVGGFSRGESREVDRGAVGWATFTLIVDCGDVVGVGAVGVGAVSRFGLPVPVNILPQGVAPG